MNLAAVSGYLAVLEFWFDEIEPKQWWQQSENFDAMIRRRFGNLHAQAVCCELYGWRKTAAGRLAEVIAIDQFSRNLHRGSAQAFAADAMALALAQEAVAAGADMALPSAQAAFFYALHA